MTPQEKLDYVTAELTEIKAIAEAHHGDQPLHVVLHGLTVDVPERIGMLLRMIDPSEDFVQCREDEFKDVPF